MIILLFPLQGEGFVTVQEYLFLQSQLDHVNTQPPLSFPTFPESRFIGEKDLLSRPVVSLKSMAGS